MCYNCGGRYGERDKCIKCNAPIKYQQVYEWQNQVDNNVLYIQRLKKQLSEAEKDLELIKTKHPFNKGQQ